MPEQEHLAVLIGCYHCGLVQKRPHQPASHHYLACARCQHKLTFSNLRSNRLSAALASSALIFYLPAISLPMLKIEKLGHHNEDSLWSGISTLWSQEHWFIGMIIFIFSLLLPLTKLTALLLLSINILRGKQLQTVILYWTELLGRWSMLDVMLVAILIAFVKLGDLINISPGHGLFAFIGMVLLSLLASLSFNPSQLWQAENA